MVTDKRQREDIRMRDTAARPAAANLDETLIVQFVEGIGHIFAGDAVGDELRVGHDKPAICQGGVRGVLDDDAEEGAAGIGAQ